MSGLNENKPRSELCREGVHLCNSFCPRAVCRVLGKTFNLTSAIERGASTEGVVFVFVWASFVDFPELLAPYTGLEDHFSLSGNHQVFSTLRHSRSESLDVKAISPNGHQGLVSPASKNSLIFWAGSFVGLVGGVAWILGYHCPNQNGWFPLGSREITNQNRVISHLELEQLAGRAAPRRDNRGVRADA